MKNTQIRIHPEDKPRFDAIQKSYNDMEPRRHKLTQEDLMKILLDVYDKKGKK